jgi:glutathione S-transferase
MKLYYNIWSPYSRKALLAAYEKSIHLERELVPIPDLPKLKQLDPFGSVPMLLLDNGTFMRESTIIMEYFELAFPDAPALMPRDPAAALEARAFDRFGDNHLIGPAGFLNWKRDQRTDARTDERWNAKLADVRLALSVLDKALEGKRYLLGDDLTMADIAPVSGLHAFHLGKIITDLSEWQNVDRWFDRTLARPAYAPILEELRCVPSPIDGAPSS